MTLRKYLLTGLLLTVALTAMARFATPQLSVGTDSFTYRGYAPFADRPIKVVYHIPTKGNPLTMPIIFVFQGADRGHDYLLRGWRERAEREGFMVFIPQFDKEPYPLAAYQEVGIMDAHHRRLVARDSITPQLIDHLFLEIKALTGTHRTGYRLYGHSAGGQFVQRMMLFHDSPYVERAIIGSPGWYTFPDREQRFSYGIGNVPYVDDARLRRYFAKDIVVQLAECDTVREWFLRKTPEADLQGRNRLERGKTFYDYCRRLCVRKGWPFRWRLVVVPRLRHQSVEMGMAAVPLLLEPMAAADSHTPTLSQPRGMAPSARINAFMDSLVAAHRDVAAIKTIGQTPEGRPVRVVYLGRQGSAGAPLRAWLMGGLHGNEPAPPEALCGLAAWLVNHPEGQRLLDSLSVAMVAVANPNGYDMGKRAAASGIDLNRDQTKMREPLSALLKEAQLAWQPHLTLDFHEYNPHRKEFDKLHLGPLETAADVLLLPSGHPNIHPQLRHLATEVFNASAARALESLGYTVGGYFTPAFTSAHKAINKYGKSPQSSSTWNALAGSVSLFVEIKGIGMGRRLFDKRVSCGMTVARDYLLTAVRHRQEVIEAVTAARKEVMRGQKEVVVKAAPAVYEDTLRMVNLASGDTLRVVVEAHDGLRETPTLVRPRPKAYLFDAKATEAVRRLRAMGIEVKPLGRRLKAVVEEYEVVEMKRDSALWEGIHRMDVVTKTLRRRRIFAPTTYVAYTAQPLGNLLVSVVEPEAACGLVNFGAIETKKGAVLPLWRWNKD